MYRMSGRSGPPAWLIILTAAMLVFGGFFIWRGVQNYLRGTALQVFQATENPESFTAVFATPARDPRFTPVPTRTPIPDCQDFEVTVPEAIIRECASVNCPLVDVRREGDVVCVLQPDYTEAEWYIIDLDDSQFFTDIAYMHESIIRAVNPTPTPSMTLTATPTLTPVPSETPLPTPLPTDTPGTATPPSRTPTFTPTPTPPLVSG